MPRILYCSCISFIKWESKSSSHYYTSTKWEGLLLEHFRQSPSHRFTSLLSGTNRVPGSFCTFPVPTQDGGALVPLGGYGIEDFTLGVLTSFAVLLFPSPQVDWTREVLYVCVYVHMYNSNLLNCTIKLAEMSRITFALTGIK